MIIAGEEMPFPKLPTDTRLGQAAGEWGKEV
jgi:hypothetical protein